MQLPEEFGTTDVEIAPHLPEYEVERRVTRIDDVEMVELPDIDSNPPAAHDPIPAAQEEPQSTTPAPEPTSEETPTTDEAP